MKARQLVEEEPEDELPSVGDRYILSRVEAGLPVGTVVKITDVIPPILHQSEPDRWQRVIIPDTDTHVVQFEYPDGRIWRWHLPGFFECWLPATRKNVLAIAKSQLSSTEKPNA